MTPHAVRATPTTEPAPAFLTVEEAAAVLRIGRTAAYALTRQWRATGGSEGLPVVRFGRLLRVPVHELERLAAGAIDLTDPPPSEPALESQPAPSQRTTETRRPRRKPADAQASLFPEAS